MQPQHAMDQNPLYTIAPRKARVEIIPLIDVIFFLLATFVLFTLSLDKLGTITVPLPKLGPPGEDITLFIQASAPGAFYWKEGPDGPLETLSATELRPRLEDYKRRAAAPRVFIRGDSKAKFGSTVMILDEVRVAGIRQVSIETLVSNSGN